MTSQAVSAVRVRLLVVVALAALAIACTFVEEATPTPIPVDASNQSKVQAVAWIKIFWRKNQEQLAEEIRSGSHDQAAWEFFGACKQRTPQESWASQCGEYADAKSAAEDMAKKAVELADKGSWTAEWDPGPRTWTATASIGAFEWKLRLLENTGDVGLIPHP